MDTNQNLDNCLFGTTQESAYCLGYLWADGYIRANCARVDLECIKTDIDDVYNIFLKTRKLEVFNTTKTWKIRASKFIFNR